MVAVGTVVATVVAVVVAVGAAMARGAPARAIIASRAPATGKVATNRGRNLLSFCMALQLPGAV
jgi:hypothetical protein